MLPIVAADDDKYGERTQFWGRFILKGLSHGILSYFEHRQNYR